MNLRWPASSRSILRMRRWFDCERAISGSSSRRKLPSGSEGKVTQRFSGFPIE